MLAYFVMIFGCNEAAGRSRNGPAMDVAALPIVLRWTVRDLDD